MLCKLKYQISKPKFLILNFFNSSFPKIIKITVCRVSKKWQNCSKFDRFPKIVLVKLHFNQSLLMKKRDWRTFKRLSEDTRTGQGLSKGVARTTMGHMGNCKGLMGTTQGQAQDKTQTEEGRHQGKVQFYIVLAYGPQEWLC